MRTQIATNVSLATRRQANELVEQRGYSIRDIVTIGIKMLHQEEFGTSTYYDVDFHNTNCKSGDQVRLIKIQRTYTSTPHWSGEKGPKVGDQRISYGFIVSDEPYKSQPDDYQETNCVVSIWDNGGFIVERIERIDFDTLRVWVRN